MSKDRKNFTLGFEIFLGNLKNEKIQILDFFEIFLIVKFLDFFFDLEKGLFRVLLFLFKGIKDSCQEGFLVYLISL